MIFCEMYFIKFIWKKKFKGRGPCYCNIGKKKVQQIVEYDCNRCWSFAGSASLSQMGSCGGGGRGGGVSMNNAPTNRHSAYPYMSGGGQENSPYMMGGEPPNMKYSDTKCSSSKSMESEMAMNGMGLSSSSGGGGLDHCGPGDMGMLARLTSDQGHSTC